MSAVIVPAIEDPIVVVLKATTGDIKALLAECHAFMMFSGVPETFGELRELMDVMKETVQVYERGAPSLSGEIASAYFSEIHEQVHLLKKRFDDSNFQFTLAKLSAQLGRSLCSSLGLLVSKLNLCMHKVIQNVRSTGIGNSHFAHRYRCETTRAAKFDAILASLAREKSIVVERRGTKRRADTALETMAMGFDLGKLGFASRGCAVVRGPSEDPSMTD